MALLRQPLGKMSCIGQEIRQIPKRESSNCQHIPMPDSDFRSPDGGNENPRFRRGVRAGHPADVEGGGRALDFANAAAVLERSLGDEGTDAWTPVAFGRRRDVETSVLFSWAEENGFWIPENLIAGIERGRMEHDLIYVGKPPIRVMKLTRGPKFGFYPHCDPSLVSGMVMTKDLSRSRP